MSGTIRGIVVSPAGTPIADATVLIDAGPGPTRDVAALTDEAGRFVLGGLPEGAYRLRAIDPDAHTGWTEVAVAPGDIVETRVVIR
ncbi:MAG: carboxypeptidase-like regulatory domain-containing protein [Actinomycetota bacterium]|jgi:hypothetical protein